MFDLIMQNSSLIYFLIFTIIMLEYANVPLPSEIVLPLAGAIAIPFDLKIESILILSIIGGLTGSLINYYLGFKFGEPIVSWTLTKFPKSKKSLNVSYRAFKKYDKLSILFTRLIPIARTAISVIAGILKMNCFQFILFSSIGITIWNTILIIAGYILFDNLGAIISILATYSLIIKIIIIIIASYLLIRYIKTRKDK